MISKNDLPNRLVYCIIVSFIIIICLIAYYSQDINFIYTDTIKYWLGWIGMICIFILIVREIKHNNIIWSAIIDYNKHKEDYNIQQWTIRKIHNERWWGRYNNRRCLFSIEIQYDQWKVKKFYLEIKQKQVPIEIRNKYKISGDRSPMLIYPTQRDIKKFVESKLPIWKEVNIYTGKKKSKIIFLEDIEKKEFPIVQ